MGSIRKKLIEEIDVIVKEDIAMTWFDLVLMFLCHEYRNLSTEIEILDYLVSKKHHFISLKKDVVLNISLDNYKFEFNIYGFNFVVFSDNLKLNDINIIIRNLFLGEYEVINYKSLKGKIIYSEIHWKDVLLENFNVVEKVSIKKRNIVDHDIWKGILLIVK